MQDSAPKANNSPVPTGPPRAIGRSFVLRFISGKYQGGEFPIVPDKQIIVGRSSDLDMVLVEDMVSRRHARIALQQDQIWIEDLGSTNGTFVNGEKIKRARLKEGDRVLIGTSILKVIASENTSEGSAPKAPNYKAYDDKKGTQTRTMSGSIEEVPLPDLLQLFGTSKKNGVLFIRTEGETGKIYMRKGNVYHATIEEAPEVPTLKSLYRMLAWEKGVFDLEPPDATVFPNELDVTVQEVLMEGLRQLDEFNVMRDKLPPPHARLVVPQPLTHPLRELSKEELDTFQLILNEGTVEGVFNRSIATDLATGTILQKLLKAGYVESDA
jgi:pSer/pThr/pTyr-binding forkhead associated (FHA) protein